MLITDLAMVHSSKGILHLQFSPLPCSGKGRGGREGREGGKGGRGGRGGKGGEGTEGREGGKALTVDLNRCMGMAA
jgi:hypothetical protein